MTNGAGLCYLVRCVGTHQVPLDRIAYLEAAFQHTVINATATQTDSPDSSLGVTCNPVLKHRQNMLSGDEPIMHRATGLGYGGDTHRHSMRFIPRSCGHCPPPPVTPAPLLAILSSSPPRKPPCPQCLSKQEFGSAAIHRLP